MINDFVVDLISYVSTQLALDSNLPTVKVNRAYAKNTEISSPQVSIYILSDDDYERASTFDSENATTYPVQFYCYWKDGIKYGSNAYGAQLGAELLGEKVSALFDNKANVIQSYFNNNIKMIQKTGGSPFGMPVSNGSANYQSIPRFVFTIKKPYTASSVNNNN